MEKLAQQNQAVEVPEALPQTQGGRREMK